jgi:hypothetical protein
MLQSSCSRVRAPLEPVCAAGRTFVAGRRDLRENPWQVGYLYGAADHDGKTVDFRLSTRRDVAAAKAFLRKAALVQIVLQCESANSQPFEFVGLYRSTLR